MKKTFVSYVKKNNMQKKNAAFYNSSFKGTFESLVASFHNGVEQQLISSTFEKIKLLKEEQAK